MLGDFDSELSARIKQVFDEPDEGGAGHISNDELKATRTNLGQTPAAMPWFMRHPGPADATTAVTGESTDNEEGEASLSDAEEGGSWCTPNIKVLGLTATLFGVITLAQAVGAHMAQSRCLLADCVSMGVDACTYVGNIVVECQRGTRWYKPLELMVGGVSLAMLAYFTFVVMPEALATILKPRVGEEEAVNGYIVLSFACLGILFDCASLYAFRKEAEGTGEAANLWTALMHVGADLLRSSTTFVSSILMLFFKVNTSTVDSYAALVVGITILGGAALGLLELLRSADKLSVGAVLGVVGCLTYLCAKALV